jgi:hypothetical protein
MLTKLLLTSEKWKHERCGPGLVYLYICSEIYCIWKNPINTQSSIRLQAEALHNRTHRIIQRINEAFENKQYCSAPELACSISRGVARKVIRDWTIRDHRKYWDYLSGHKQAKAIIQGPSTIWWLLKLNRNQPQWVSQDTFTFTHFRTGINK